MFHERPVWPAAAPAPAVVSLPAPHAGAPTVPTLHHLGVVGLSGTIGAAARVATARAAAERRFMGADPRHHAPRRRDGHLH